MTFNETAINATNQTDSGLPPIDDISFFQNLFSDTQQIVSDKLISWEMIPEDIYFRLLVLAMLAALILLVIVKLSNFFSGGVRIVIIVILVLLVCVVAGVI